MFEKRTYRDDLEIQKKKCNFATQILFIVEY